MAALNEDDVVQLMDVSTMPAFHAAHEGLRKLFHFAFLSLKTDKMVGLDFTSVQSYAQQLLAYPAVVRVVECKENAMLDDIVAMAWDGSEGCTQLVTEQLANLDTISTVLELAGHRTLRKEVETGRHYYDVTFIVRLFRAFDAVHRNVVMVREQRRLYDYRVSYG